MIYPSSFIDYCDSLQMKLSALRKEVLYILWHAQKPLKAYEILERLLTTKANSKPPTVYRSLDFLVNLGVAHKIESIQSYTLCCKPDAHLNSELLMVCTYCRQVTELHDAAFQLLVMELAQKTNFRLKEDTIELKGLCSLCQDQT
ncbi:MAG: Fur family transcriptional regulator [Legionella sp.]